MEITPTQTAMGEGAVSQITASDWKKEVDRLAKITAELAKEKDPITHTRADAFYAALGEYNAARGNLNAALDKEATAHKNTAEYKADKEVAAKLRGVEFHRQERENEITSMTHENWKKRQENAVVIFMKG